MNLGLLPETSWKDVTFVNPSVDFRRDVDASPIKMRRHSASRSPKRETSDREDVAVARKSATPSAAGVLWPFVHSKRNRRTLTKPVRKSGRRSKRRWTTIQQKKSKHATSEINGTTDFSMKRLVSSLQRKTGEKVDVPAARAGLSRNNFSLTQLRAQSSDREVETRERPDGRYRSASDDDEVRRATWGTDPEEIARIDYAVGSTRSELLPSRGKEESRDRPDSSERSEYRTNFLRDGVEDAQKDTMLNYDRDDTESMESASLAERLSRVNGACKKRNTSICKSSRSQDTARRKRKNGRLESHGNHSVIHKRRGEISMRRRKRRAPATDNNSTKRDCSRVPCDPRANSPRRESGSKCDVAVDYSDARDTPGKIQKCRVCDMPRRSHDFANVSCACKENVKSTATAIMQDIQAQIYNAEIVKHDENIISEVPLDDPSEEREKALDRDIFMEYDCVYEDGFDKEGNLSQSSKQSSADNNPCVSSMEVLANRKRRKKRSSAFSIDCGSVDKTETTYQGVFHECIDFDSSASASCLKINVDENQVLEDDAGMTRSSWPRSSLNEENDKFDSSLLTSLQTVSDDEQTAANMCYKYQNETSDDATKNMITYVNKKRNNEKPFLTNRHSVPPDDRVKVENRATRSTADRNKVDPIRRGANDKGNDTQCDIDKRKEHAVRRMTRASKKTTNKSCIGKLVWGYCSGWWPALIVDAAHVGMVSESGKLWVYWIGESQISQLNEKTQIESFSRKLEDRLTQKLRKNSRSQAIDETIQMLRQRYDCTLTKPYYNWIQRNIPTSEELDNLNFYPYADKIQEKLDTLKEQNAKATRRYISQRNSPEMTKKQIAEKSKDTKVLKRIEEERLPLQEQYPGVIVWAKITGHNWWPAMIIDYRDCCLKEPSFGCQWIMWYGDYTVSQVHHLAFLKFHKGMEKMRDYVENTKKHLYLVGVLQASKDYCSRLGCNTDSWSLNNVFKYFSDMNDTHVPYNCLQVSESSKIYDKYSDEIVKKINELKADTNVDDKRKNDIEASDALRRVTLGKSTIEKLCLKCLKFPKDAIEEHPFFIGSLCKDCSNLFKPCMFVYGNDDKCFYCTVCAGTGMVVICDREDCARVYCTACLKFLICPEAYEDMLLEDPWECFLCRDESRLPTSGLLRPRLDWKEKITGMFRTVSNHAPDEQVLNCSGEKRGVRVLSLFDGLSTGLLVLLKLGIVVEVYYASEIDKDSLMVSTAHYGDRIHSLGDVRTITKNKIKEIAPIDLLIGGSPCNDLSLVNPARLGLHDPRGTGILFFDYCRILKELKRVNKDRHLFWFYENVAAMPSEYRLEMNKHLGREPVVIDSADFSPQHRLRLYWHNLPYNPYLPSFHTQQDVQDILTPHCNRYSLVKKIRTVTTRKNSLRQGKSELKPIMMMGESDTLWITELEEIFGFPRHYTDVKNLSASNRQRLIGKSWSVQTLTAILRPLCSFFKCNKDETS